MNLGPEAEDAVEEAVKELIDEDKRFTGYIRAKFSDRLDHEGIDIMLFLVGGAALPVQIKSTYRHVHSFKKKHPNVKYILFVRKRPLLDKKSSYYRSTLEYIKRKLTQYATRIIRDAVKLFPETVSPRQ